MFAFALGFVSGGVVCVLAPVVYEWFKKATSRVKSEFDN